MSYSVTTLGAVSTEGKKPIQEGVRNIDEARLAARIQVAKAASGSRSTLYILIAGGLVLAGGGYWFLKKRKKAAP